MPPVEGDSSDPRTPGVTGKNSSSTEGVGVFGQGPIGVQGFGPTGGMPGAGVLGTSFSTIGAGVRGANSASGGLAGDFQGKVNVTGDMTVGGNINVSGDVFLTSKDVAECFDVDAAADW